MSSYKRTRIKTNFDGMKFNNFKTFIEKYSDKKLVYTITSVANIKIRVGHIYLMNDEYYISDSYDYDSRISIDKTNLGDFLFMIV